jgi:hypothetical protein
MHRNAKLISKKVLICLSSVYSGYACLLMATLGQEKKHSYAPSQAFNSGQWANISFENALSDRSVNLEFGTIKSV